MAGKEIPVPTPGMAVLWESTEGGVHRVTKRFNPSVHMKDNNDAIGRRGRYGEGDIGLVGGTILAGGGEAKGEHAYLILKAKGVPDPISDEAILDLCVALDKGATGHVPDAADYLDIVGVPDTGGSISTVPPAIPDGHLMPTPLMSSEFKQELAATESRLLSAIKAASAPTSQDSGSSLDALVKLKEEAAAIESLGTPRHQRYDALVAAIAAAVAAGGA